MNKITKQQDKERDDLVSEMRTAAEELEQAIDEYNRQVEQLKSPVEQALEKYNGLLEKASALATEVSEEAQSAWDDKSERWQEGERGQEVQEWINEWGNATFDEAEIEFPDALSMPDTDAVDTLEQLPSEVGSIS